MKHQKHSKKRLKDDNSVIAVLVNKLSTKLGETNRGMVFQHNLFFVSDTLKDRKIQILFWYSDFDLMMKTRSFNLIRDDNQ